MKKLLICLVFVSVAFAAGTAGMPFNPSQLPAPKAEPAPIPDDGSGVYRFSLENAFEPTSLTVLLEVRDGKAVKAAVLPLHLGLRGGWWSGSPEGLTIKDGRVTGTVSFECLPVLDVQKYDWHPRRLRVNEDYKPFEFKAYASGKVELDVSADGHAGDGSYVLHTPDDLGQLNPRHKHQTGKKVEGKVRMRRESAGKLSADYECELILNDVLKNAPFLDEKGLPLKQAADWTNATLRYAVRGGKVSEIALYVRGGGKLSKSYYPSPIAQHDLKVDDSGRLHGGIDTHIPGLPEETYRLDFEGVGRIGRRMWGTVTLTREDHRQTTPWTGVLQDLDKSSLNITMPGPVTWEAPLTLDADERLAARAAKESLKPVMPGQPGKAGFWTWRPLLTRGSRGKISCIHPPSFDLKEVENAAKYRFAITGSKLKETFEADQPWATLAPVWGKLPTGEYRLKVTPLNAEGKAIEAAMRMGVIDRKTGKPGTVEIKQIGIAKRPSFAGPYREVDRSFEQAALQLARIHRNDLSKPSIRGAMLPGTHHWMKSNGDHGFASPWAAATWTTLAYRSLTSESAERAWGEDMVQFQLDEMIAHLAGKPKVPYDYQHQTPLAHWALEALCDAYLQTGEDRFRDQAILVARGLRDHQHPDGSFVTDWGKRSKKPEDWYGSIKKLEYYPTFATAELLYALGRVRRDCKTDEFVEVERKAYEWAMENQVAGRFWPVHVCHSASQGYPVKMHSVSAWYFCRYLLEVAPKDRRDVKLAEQLARWGEDYRVEWHRRAAGPGERIYPRIDKMDRYNNSSIATSMVAAIVFEELARATGDELWRAKSRALARAAVMGIHPDGHVAEYHMVTSKDLRATEEGHWTFHYGWTAQLMREYAQLRSGKGK